MAHAIIGTVQRLIQVDIIIYKANIYIVSCTFLAIALLVFLLNCKMAADSRNYLRSTRAMRCTQYFSIFVAKILPTLSICFQRWDLMYHDNSKWRTIITFLIHMVVVAVSNLMQSGIQMLEISPESKFMIVDIQNYLSVMQMTRAMIIFSAYDNQSAYFYAVKYVLIGFIFLKQVGMIVYAKIYIELLFTFWFSF